MFPNPEVNWAPDFEKRQSILESGPKARFRYSRLVYPRPDAMGYGKYFEALSAPRGRLQPLEGKNAIEEMATGPHYRSRTRRDIHAVLAKVQEGVDLIVEQDHRPVAAIRAPHRSGRPISEILRQAKDRNSTVTLDPDFGKDLEAVIAGHPPRAWDRLGPMP